ncbi:MAG: hypothetical protein J5778_02980 [Clostridiales bacterium]|nr:hypothetical protein [Clostridiales bacterium]
MFSGFTIKRYICAFLVIAYLFAVTCCAQSGTDDRADPSVQGNPGDSSVPNDTVPDGYILNSVVQDGEYCGRVYKDQLILNLDGKQYLAVGLFIDFEEEYPYLGAHFGKELDIYYSDEDIKSLKVGDEFKFDSDIRFEIESLDETDWEPPYYLPDVPNGKIILNDDFCLIHGQYIRDDYDNIVDWSRSEKWILTTENNIKTQGIGIFPVFEHKLYEYSDKCIFKYYDYVGDGEYHTINREDLNKLFEVHDGICGRYGYCSFTVRRNQIVEVCFAVGRELL